MNRLRPSGKCPRSSSPASDIASNPRIYTDILIVKLYPPGYGKVAASIDADPGFLVFRRFGWLHNYVLLELQDELAQLEQSLESHDRNEHKHGIAKRLKSRRMDIGMKESRHDLLTTIQKKLAEYGKCFVTGCHPNLASLKQHLPRVR